jgi:DNA-binding XRE family transcriptional regulator
MPKQNTNPADYPQAVLQQIELLGQNIAIARKRRGETQTQWAQRLGVSQPTMARIERGDPSVAMASYVMCMWLVNSAVAVADLIAPPNDHAALEREVFRVRKARKTPQKRLGSQSGATSSTGKKSQEHAPVKSTSAAVSGKSVERQPEGVARGSETISRITDAVFKQPQGASFPSISVDAENLQIARSAADSLERLSKASGLGSYEDDLDRLKKSLTGGATANAIEEIAKSRALGSRDSELDRLKQSLAGGTFANALEELSKSSALGSYEEDLDRLKKSLAEGSIGSGLAALMLKGPSGAK